MQAGFFIIVFFFLFTALVLWKAWGGNDKGGVSPGKGESSASVGGKVPVVRASAVVGGDYASLLRDPRWLAKRRRIMARDGNRCVWCGSREGLQVHHKFYARYPRGRYADPWDYQDNALVTLCRRCHERWHATHANKVYWRGRGIHYDA